MNSEHPFTVQYVGFSTQSSPELFLRIWKPIAQSFKNRGILNIDLYKVTNPEAGLQYISRNVWPTEHYFRAFPDGLPEPVRNPFVKIHQYGGFGLLHAETDFAKKNPGFWLEFSENGTYPRVRDRILHKYATESTTELTRGFVLKHYVSL
jgi:hypothetical protein